MERTLTPLHGYEDMVWAIQKAGAWFIGSFMVEFVDSYEEFQDKTRKARFISNFMEEYDSVTDDIEQLRNRINLAIRIIESDMVEDAMEFVLNTNDFKLGCDESKTNAQFMLDRLKTGESKLAVFDE